MEIVKATESDILELYRLQLLTFESEAEMIGSVQTAWEVLMCLII